MPPILNKTKKINNRTPTGRTISKKATRRNEQKSATNATTEIVNNTTRKASANRRNAEIKRQTQTRDTAVNKKRFKSVKIPPLPENEIVEIESGLVEIDSGLNIIKRVDPQPFASTSELYSSSASTVFTHVFRFHPTVFLAATETLPKLKMTTARDWWERASISQQCDNVIGKFKQNTICYICGFPIKQLAECEHVLPVVSAAMFLHLYRNEFKFDERVGYIFDSLGNSTSPHDLNVIMFELLLEYKWAHRCCNQIKSDINFIKVVESSKTSKKPKLELNTDSAMYILERIFNTLITRGTSKSDICNDKILKSDFIKSVFGGTSVPSDQNAIEGIRQRWIQNRIEVLIYEPKFNASNDEQATQSVNDYMVEHKGAVGAILRYLNKGITLSQNWINKLVEIYKYPTPIQRCLQLMFVDGGNAPIEDRRLVKFGSSLTDPQITDGLFAIQSAACLVSGANLHDVRRVESVLSGIPYEAVTKPVIVPKKEVYTLATTIAYISRIIEDSLRFDWGINNLPSVPIAYARRPIDFYFENIFSMTRFAKDFNVNRGRPKSDQRISATITLSIGLLFARLPKYREIFRIIFAIAHYKPEINAPQVEAAEMARLGFSFIIMLYYYNKIEKVGLTTDVATMGATAISNQNVGGFTGTFLTKINKALENICNELLEIHIRSGSIFSIIRHFIHITDPELDRQFSSIMERTGLNTYLTEEYTSFASNILHEENPELGRLLTYYFIDNSKSERILEDFETNYINDSEFIKQLKELSTGAIGLMKMKSEQLTQDQIIQIETGLTDVNYNTNAIMDSLFDKETKVIDYRKDPEYDAVVIEEDEDEEDEEDEGAAINALTGMQGSMPYESSAYAALRPEQYPPTPPPRFRF